MTPQNFVRICVIVRAAGNSLYLRRTVPVYRRILKRPVSPASQPVDLPVKAVQRFRDGGLVARRVTGGSRDCEYLPCMAVASTLALLGLAVSD